MASNNLANIAAATAAGWKLRRPSVSGKYAAELSKNVSGVAGQSGHEHVAAGESAVSQAAADTAALANLNAWRANRYGSDSGGSNRSSNPDASTSPSTQGTSPSHSNLTKDQD